ncbi:hypothetical protein J6590_058286 [Homalodisca vitripennis]|nr:hypothetical protein J6590_058286 [Homalodisca vitripennis]
MRYRALLEPSGPITTSLKHFDTDRHENGKSNVWYLTLSRIDSWNLEYVRVKRSKNVGDEEAQKGEVEVSLSHQVHNRLRCSDTIAKHPRNN